MFFTLLASWIINALALLIVSNVIPGFEVSDFYAALVAALILGFVNATIRWILVILTLPITIVTLGLFTFVINALMIWLVATIVEGFSVTSFSAALMGAILLWLISFFTNVFLKAGR